MKNTVAIGVLITAEYSSVVHVYTSCTCLSSRLEFNSRLLDKDVGMCGCWTRMLGCVGQRKKKFGCKPVDDNGDGLNVYCIVQVGIGSRSATPDRSGVVRTDRMSNL